MINVGTLLNEVCTVSQFNFCGKLDLYNYGKFDQFEIIISYLGIDCVAFPRRARLRLGRISFLVSQQWQRTRRKSSSSDAAVFCRILRVERRWTSLEDHDSFGHRSPRQDSSQRLLRTYEWCTGRRGRRPLVDVLLLLRSQFGMWKSGLLVLRCHSSPELIKEEAAVAGWIVQAVAGTRLIGGMEQANQIMLVRASCWASAWPLPPASSCGQRVQGGGWPLAAPLCPARSPASVWLNWPAQD